MTGTVYLLHLEPGLPVTGSRVARHYLGWTAGEDVQPRLDQHLAGRGSPLVAAVIAAGGTATLARTWPHVDRHFERRLKRRHEAPRLCPHCVAAGHTKGRGPLLTDRRPAPAEDNSAGAGAAPRPTSAQPPIGAPPPPDLHHPTTLFRPTRHVRSLALA